MRVNIYAEEMPDAPRIEVIEKEIDAAPWQEKLDQAWAEINAEGGSSHNVDVYTQGYLDAIDKALEVIEKLGGMDPAERSKND